MPDDELVIEVGDVRVSLTRKDHVGHLQVKGCKSMEGLSAVLSEEQMRSLAEFLLGGGGGAGDVASDPCDICGRYDD